MAPAEGNIARGRKRGASDSPQSPPHPKKAKLSSSVGDGGNESEDSIPLPDSERHDSSMDIAMSEDRSRSSSVVDNNIQSQPSSTSHSPTPSSVCRSPHHMYIPAGGHSSDGPTDTDDDESDIEMSAGAGDVRYSRASADQQKLDEWLGWTSEEDHAGNG